MNHSSSSSSDNYDLMQDEGSSNRDMLLIDLSCRERSISVIMGPQCYAISRLCPRQLHDGWLSATEKDFVFMPGDQ